MEFNRRSFIKYVIAGSLVALCPIDITLRAELPAPPMVDGEHFDICHQLRDARVLKPRPRRGTTSLSWAEE